MSVGNSEFRTMGKHGALNAILGKTVGVMKSRFKGMQLALVDCTAGDGVATAHSPMTSPAIFDKHGSWAREHGIPTKVVMYERGKKPGVMLKEKYGRKWNVNAGEDATTMPRFWQDDSVLFVSNDPNTVADWALPPSLLYAPRLTTVFSTLGCNAGGLKRLDAESRSLWYRQMGAQIRLLQKWHDAYLVMLEGDKSQWAYLVNAPSKWRQDTEKAFCASFKDSPYPLRGAWLKDDPDRFSAMVDWLFLTRKEFAQKHNTTDIYSILDGQEVML